jgi:transposase
MIPHMATRNGPVHVVTTKRRYKGSVYQTHLLRRSYREDGKVKNETVGNLSHLPEPVIELVRQSLRGVTFVEAERHFEIQQSRAHGHVDAVLKAMRRLGFAQLLSSRACRERDLLMAMIAARVIDPRSKLATTRAWHNTTLPRALAIEDANEDDLYAAMDWLLERQPAIEKKLAKRHLNDGGLVLYDVTSSYFEGRCCPLARLGYSRDRKKGTLQVNYGLVTDPLGCPVAVSVFDGNVNDTKTLLPTVNKVRGQLGIERMVIVGDRGMISQKQIDELGKQSNLDWVTALRSPAIRELVASGPLQLGLFDERNLFEFEHPDYPGERLVACRNQDLAAHRAAKRQALLQATKERLQRIQASVDAGRLRGKAKIGVRVGKEIARHKVEKHFDLTIEDDRFAFEVNDERVAAEAQLDGIYVLRTSLPRSRLDGPGVVLAYKQLTHVERAFRSFKTIDLHVRPIHHWSENRVRAHIFLCMLSYYVQYHMQEAWRSLLFSDEEAWLRERADVVAPAQRSASALQKVRTRRTESGDEVHSFRTLLADLATVTSNSCRRRDANAGEPTFTIFTTPTEQQRNAIALLDVIRT